jgi:hypothetical protein
MKVVIRLLLAWIYAVAWLSMFAAMCVLFLPLVWFSEWLSDADEFTKPTFTYRTWQLWGMPWRSQ